MVARILSRESPGRSSGALTCFRIRGRALAEGSERRVLGLVAHGAPARVVAVLFATLAVPSSRLDVPVRPGADPAVRPRRGHGKLTDPSERREVADGGAVLLVVALGTLITRVALRGRVTTRRTSAGTAAGRAVRSATFEW